MSEEAIYPIRKVSELTGVNTVTIRAWERRYGLINPTRTAKGHRLYSEADISDIKKIVRYINEGIALAKIKQLLKEPDQNELESEINHQTSVSHWQPTLDQIQLLIQNKEVSSLHSIFDQLFKEYPIDIIYRNIFSPLLAQLLLSQHCSMHEVEFLIVQLTQRCQHYIFKQNNKIKNYSTLLLADNHPLSQIEQQLYGLHLAFQGVGCYQVQFFAGLNFEDLTRSYGLTKRVVIFAHAHEFLHAQVELVLHKQELIWVAAAQHSKLLFS